MDIGAGAHPHQDLPGAVFLGQCPAQLPAVLPVVATETMFHEKNLSGSDGLQPSLHILRAVIRMYDLQPSVLRHLFRTQAGVGVYGLIKIIQVPLLIAGPHELRHGIGQQVKTFQAQAQGLLYFFAFIDVAADGGHADDLIGVVFNGEHGVIHPDRRLGFKMPETNLHFGIVLPHHPRNKFLPDEVRVFRKKEVREFDRLRSLHILQARQFQPFRIDVNGHTLQIAGPDQIVAVFGNMLEAEQFFCRLFFVRNIPGQA